MLMLDIWIESVHGNISMDVRPSDLMFNLPIVEDERSMFEI